jgi:hypothetical protein
LYKNVSIWNGNKYFCLLTNPDIKIGQLSNASKEKCQVPYQILHFIQSWLQDSICPQILS